MLSFSKIRGPGKRKAVFTWVLFHIFIRFLVSHNLLIFENYIFNFSNPSSSYSYFRRQNKILNIFYNLGNSFSNVLHQYLVSVAWVLNVKPNRTIILTRKTDAYWKWNYTWGGWNPSQVCLILKFFRTAMREHPSMADDSWADLLCLPEDHTHSMKRKRCNRSSFFRSPKVERNIFSAGIH